MNSSSNLPDQLTTNDICMVVGSGCYELIPHTDNVPPPDNFIQIHLTLQHTLANTTWLNTTNTSPHQLAWFFDKFHKNHTRQPQLLHT